MYLRSAWALKWGWEMLGYSGFHAIQEAIFIKQRIARLEAILMSERLDHIAKNEAERFRKSKSDADWRIFTEGTQKEKKPYVKMGGGGMVPPCTMRPASFTGKDEQTS